MPLKCGYKDKTFNALEFNYERVQTDISKASCFRQCVARVVLDVDKMIWIINKNNKSLQSVFFSFIGRCSDPGADSAILQSRDRIL